MTRRKPIVLCILDGWGVSEDKKYCAITKANTPNYDEIINKYPHSSLNASGGFVGLPDGQMGNSEVGHTIIGAGRVILQSLPKINKSIAEGTLKNRKAIQKTIRRFASFRIVFRWRCPLTYQSYNRFS
jgi:2,3-bisphosphoglycerate-independent phosphoglycerate mutase